MKKMKCKAISIGISAGVFCLLYIIFDYWNLPSRFGISVINLNLDLLSIIVGNIIVLTIAVITFVLIDARNIEKDDMAKFAATYLLKETYDAIETFVPIIEDCIKSANTKDNIQEKFFNEKQLEYIISFPFENDKMIYESFSNGNMDYKFYKSYVAVRKKYEVTLSTFNLGHIKLSNDIFGDMKEQVNSEIKGIEKYLESFNRK